MLFAWTHPNWPEARNQFVPSAPTFALPAKAQIVARNNDPRDQRLSTYRKDSFVVVDCHNADSLSQYLT